jgi:hypothetical protein
MVGDPLVPLHPLVPAWIPRPRRTIWPETGTATAVMQSQDHGNQEGFLVSVTSGPDAIRRKAPQVVTCIVMVSWS